MHTHVMDELIVIIEGTLEVRIDGETHIVGKDHTLAIPPGAEHGFKVIGEGNAELLVFSPPWTLILRSTPTTWKGPGRLPRKLNPRQL